MKKIITALFTGVFMFSLLFLNIKPVFAGIGEMIGELGQESLAQFVDTGTTPGKINRGFFDVYNVMADSPRFAPSADEPESTFTSTTTPTFGPTSAQAGTPTFGPTRANTATLTPTSQPTHANTATSTPTLKPTLTPSSTATPNIDPAAINRYFPLTQKGE